MKKRLLILEDGSVYEGCGFGADHYQVGELAEIENLLEKI